jgi:hypothetical protein
MSQQVVITDEDRALAHWLQVKQKSAKSRLKNREKAL